MDHSGSPQPKAAVRSASTSIWNPDIPFNGRTAVYCFLMGAVWSAPVGWVEARFIVLNVPEVITIGYYWTLGISFVLIPFWSWLAVGKYWPLPILGVVTFVLVLLMSLFPAT
jgi:hypothetical protein